MWGCSLRAPVCKNQTSRGKSGKFDFFHILMLDRLGYNSNHCIVFSVKYPFILKKNANNETPSKSSFEALKYHTGLRASRAKTNHSTVFKTLKSFFTISKYLLE